MVEELSILMEQPQSAIIPRSIIEDEMDVTCSTYGRDVNTILAGNLDGK
jgi:hypothetical protein